MAVLKSPRNTRTKRSWATRYLRRQSFFSPRILKRLSPKASHKMDSYFLSSNLWFVHYIRQGTVSLEQPPRYISERKRKKSTRSPYPMVLAMSVDAHTSLLRLTSFLIV